VEKIAVSLKIEMTDLFDFEHEISREKLQQEINSLIRKANDEDLQKIYRILKSIMK
jgi:hypothetical protein